MTSTDSNVTESSRRAMRNVAVLFCAQALIGSQMAAHIIVGGLSGALLADNAALATLPISVVVLSSMFTSPGASLFMGKVGRRVGFVLGALVGALGSFFAMRALLVGSFGLLIFGSVLFGISQSFHGFYRFAAADTASESFKPKAISLVLAGGLLSALLGPELVRMFGDALDPTPYAGAYAAVIVVNLLGTAVLLFLDIPLPQARQKAASSGRPIGEIYRTPKVIAAVFCAMVSYAVMSLVMTSTPLAMVAFGFTSNHAADVVRWHVVAMFAPSFFTGALVARFGHAAVISTGLALLAVCAGIALAGVDIHQFYLALIALGLGWNFGFIGSTSLLATAYSPEEQAKVQGLNDFLVFGFVAFASFSSGALLNAYGWSAVQYAALPALGCAAFVMFWATRPQQLKASEVK